jgi:S1-C subfamily serine protease
VDGRRPTLATSGDRARIRVLRHGRPRALRAAVRRRVTAHVHAAAGTTRTRPALELAARVLPGDSGAPVTDARGRVLGVVFARASSGGGIAWAVDAPGVSSLLRRVTAMTSSRCRR